MAVESSTLISLVDFRDNDYDDDRFGCLLALFLPLERDDGSINPSFASVPRFPFRLRCASNLVTLLLLLLPLTALVLLVSGKLDLPQRILLRQLGIIIQASTTTDETTTAHTAIKVIGFILVPPLVIFCLGWSTIVTDDNTQHSQKQIYKTCSPSSANADRV